MNRLFCCCLAVAFFVWGTRVFAVEYRFTNIADNTTVSPQGSMFDGFREPAISGNRVAFVGSDAVGLGVFTSNGGDFTTIVRSGDLGPAGPYILPGGPAISGDLVAFNSLLKKAQSRGC